MSETLNLNDKVGVRLKPKGREMIAAAFGGVFPTWMDEETDDDGYTWMQWHELASLLGPRLMLGLDPPCETEVKIAPTETVEQEDESLEDEMARWQEAGMDTLRKTDNAIDGLPEPNSGSTLPETVEHGEDDIVERHIRVLMNAAYQTGVETPGDVRKALDAVDHWLRLRRSAPREVVELALCEQDHLILKPNTIYRFTARPNCERCGQIEAEYECVGPPIRDEGGQS